MPVSPRSGALITYLKLGTHGDDAAIHERVLACASEFPELELPAQEDVNGRRFAECGYRRIAKRTDGNALADSLPRLNSVLPTAHGASSIHERKHVPVGRCGRFHRPLRWNRGIFGDVAACTAFPGSFAFFRRHSSAIGPRLPRPLPGVGGLRGRLASAVRVPSLSPNNRPRFCPTRRRHG